MFARFYGYIIAALGVVSAVLLALYQGKRVEEEKKRADTAEKTVKRTKKIAKELVTGEEKAKDEVEKAVKRSRVKRDHFN